MLRQFLALPSVTLLALVSTACATGSTPLASATGPSPVSLAPQDFPSATEFVLHLALLAEANDRAGLDAAVDADFARRLPSGPELSSLFRSPPDGCDVELSEGPGYSAVAIPPPMVDDSDEDAARIDALIRELQSTTEVDAVCRTSGGEADDTLMLYTIAARRGPDGWRALAWRDYRSEPR